MEFNRPPIGPAEAHFIYDNPLPHLICRQGDLTLTVLRFFPHTGFTHFGTPSIRLPAPSPNH